MKITQGDIVVFKPQWRDAGDENCTFVARNDAEHGRFDVSTLESADCRIWPMQVVSVDMVEAVVGRLLPDGTVERH
jgi:hypothetical protein